jgi:hypothetical protein
MARHFSVDITSPVSILLDKGFGFSSNSIFIKNSDSIEPLTAETDLVLSLPASCSSIKKYLIIQFEVKKNYRGITEAA